MMGTEACPGLGRSRLTLRARMQEGSMACMFITGLSTGLGLLAGQTAARRTRASRGHCRRNGKRTDGMRRALPQAERWSLATWETIAAGRAFPGNVFRRIVSAAE
jgi:hypothetical protein